MVVAPCEELERRRPRQSVACRRPRPTLCHVEGWQLAVGIGGLILAGLAAFFAWRGWERGRVRWDMDTNLVRSRVDSGEMQRPDALFLTVEVRCRRSRVHIERVVLRRNRGSVPLKATDSFPGLGAPATVEIGHGTHDRFLSDRIAAHHREHGPIRQVCWVDAEDKAHCTPMPKDKLAELLADSRL